MSIDPRFSVFVDGYTYFECPRWHEDRLWLSDFYTGQVIRVALDGQVEKMADVPQQPSGLGWLPDGRLLIVSMRDRQLLRREPNGELVVHADLSGIATGHLNDMVVDARGRAYVGNFGFDLDHGADPTDATLAIVEPDGAVRAGPGDLAFPNGMVITPDGGTLIVGETMAGRLTAFTIGPNGDLADRREFARTEGALPDGICLDARGGVWIACPLTGRVLRVEAGGAITDVVTLPERKAFACMLGDDDRRTLYICAAPTFDPDETVVARNGAIESVRVDVPGAGLP